MEIRSQTQMSTALAISAAALFSGCGSSMPTVPIGSVGGGISGGTTTLPGTTAGCVPISQPIGFTAQGIYADYANIVGGRLPYTGQMIGQILVGPGAIAGGVATYSTRQGAPDGVMTLSLGSGQMNPQMTIPYTGYPNQYTAAYPSGMPTYSWTGGSNYVPSQWGPQSLTAQGVIQISQLVQQNILLQVQTGQLPLGNMAIAGYGNYGPSMMPLQGLCVSGIAMNIGKWDTQRLIYGGQVYLYLNGSTHGYVMQF